MHAAGGSNVGLQPTRCTSEAYRTAIKMVPGAFGGCRQHLAVRHALMIDMDAAPSTTLTHKTSAPPTETVQVKLTPDSQRKLRAYLANMLSNRSQSPSVPQDSNLLSSPPLASNHEQPQIQEQPPQEQPMQAVETQTEEQQTKTNTNIKGVKGRRRKANVASSPVAPADALQSTTDTPLQTATSNSQPSDQPDVATNKRNPDKANGTRIRALLKRFASKARTTSASPISTPALSTSTSTISMNLSTANQLSSIPRVMSSSQTLFRGSVLQSGQETPISSTNPLASQAETAQSAKQRPWALSRTKQKQQQAAQQTTQGNGKQSNSGLAAADQQQLLKQQLHDAIAVHNLPADVSIAVVAAAIAGRLKCNPPAALSALVQRVLTDNLGVSRQTILKGLRNAPYVFTQDTKVLQEKAAALDDMLKIPGKTCATSQADTQHTQGILQDADAVLCMVPSLWGQKPETTRAKLKHISQLLGMDHDRQRSLIRRCPTLLLLNPKSVEDKYQSLTKLMMEGGATKQQVSKVVLACPQVLFLTCEKLQAKWSDLKAILRCTPQQLTAMFTSRPLLLTSASDKLSQNWKELLAVATMSKRWQKELQASGPATPSEGRSKGKSSSEKAGLGPATRASLLLASSSKVRRLQYLVAVGQAESMALSSVMTMSSADWVKKHPRFKAWNRSFLATRLQS